MSLVNHWKLDGNTTATVGTNATWNGDGTAAAAAIAGPGNLVTTMLQGNGTNNYIGLPSISRTSGNALSIAGWVQVDSYDTTSFVWLGPSGGGVLPRVTVHDGLINVAISGNSQVWTIPQITFGVPFHLAVTFDTSNNVRVYFNGVESSTGAITMANTFTINTVFLRGTVYGNGAVADLFTYDHTLSLSEIEALYERGVEPEEPPVPLEEGVLGIFEYVESKGTAAEWTALSTNDPYFPRYIDLDFLRNAGMTLHADYDGKTKAVVVTTDHSSGTGRAAIATFSAIEDDWDIVATALFTGVQQRETAHPVYDAANNRLLVFVHDHDSNGLTENQQHVVVLSTTDLKTFTTLDSNPLNYGNHTGYGQYFDNFKGSGSWAGWHHMAGGEYYWMGASSATDPTEFTLGEHMLPQFAHVLGNGKTLSSAAWLVEFASQWYVIAMVENRPALSDNGYATIAMPVTVEPGRAPRPTGGYYTLFEKSEDEEHPTYSIQGDFSMFAIGDDWYMLGTAQDSEEVQHVVLFKMSGFEAAPFTESAASIALPKKRLSVFDWDASKAMPADVSVSAVSGTNNSSQADGRYTILTGSGAAQNVVLSLANNDIDPSEHEVVDWTVHNIMFNPTISQFQEHRIRFGQENNAATIHFNTSNSYDGGRMRVWKANSAVVDEEAYILGFNTSNSQIAAYVRSIGFHLTFRLQDYGQTLIVFVTDPNRNPRNAGQSVYYQDIASHELSWTDCVLQLSCATVGATYPETSMSFSGISINTYTSTPVSTGGARRGIVQGAEQFVEQHIQQYITN